MSFATILVFVDSDGGSNARVRLTAGLAERFKSNVLGVGAWMPRPPFVVEGVVVDPEPTETEIRGMKEALAKVGEQFKTTAAMAERQIEWRSALEFPTEFVARQARAADLIVVGRDRLPYDPYRFTDVGAVVLRVGRPVLMVPPGVQSLAVKRAVIAWKDTREARRAVQDALPLLEIASEVIVLEACETGSEQDAQHALKDVANYLARHGTTVVAERVRPVDGTASNTLLRLVEEQSADLIVAGGYGHSRLGEWVFGGMTQDLLSKSPVCCLLSH